MELVSGTDWGPTIGLPDEEPDRIWGGIRVLSCITGRFRSRAPAIVLGSRRAANTTVVHAGYFYTEDTLESIVYGFQASCATCTTPFTFGCSRRLPTLPYSAI